MVPRPAPPGLALFDLRFLPKVRIGADKGGGGASRAAWAAGWRGGGAMGGDLADRIAREVRRAIEEQEGDSVEDIDWADMERAIRGALEADRR